MTDTQSELKTVFTEFIIDSENKELDEFYHSVFENYENFHELWRIKIIFTISHGNGSFESEFSMNKNILVGNLTEDSIVSQRIVYDSINCLGGLSQVNA